MRPSIHSIFDLFDLAIRNRFAVTPPIKPRSMYDVPKGTALVGYTLTGSDRYPAEAEALIAATSTKIKPVAVSRAISA